MQHANSHDPSQPRGTSGFSLIEAVISTALALVLVGLAFTFFIQSRKGVRSEQAGVDMQQAARVSVDELARHLQQIGYGVNRTFSDNPSMWQKGLISGGAHAIAFNVDLDPALGPLDSSVDLTLPTGETYTGQGAGGATSGAETYVFSLDANGDGTVTLDDRSAAETGAFNPAASTENPLDFAVFRRVHGYDGTSNTTTLAPITPYLFTGAVSGVAYADGVIPEPLFTYVLTEDMNNDGLLDDSECVNDVVDTCPPATARAPLLYTWGDTDFNGLLSDAERSALRTLPVGAAGWSKNPLVSGGTFQSTTLQASVDPSSGSRVIEVADASKLSVGSYIRFGIGFGAETSVVQAIQIKAGNDLVSLTSVPTLIHSSGAPVEVLPDTLLRAVRAIQINFTAIAPRKDKDGDDAPVGSTGRKTEHGMDYRTLTLQRTVHLANQATVAQSGSPTGGGYVPPPAHCPLTIVTECSGTSPSQLYSLGGAEVPVAFKVTTSSNQNAVGVRMTLTHSSSSIGSLGLTEAVVDAQGLVSTVYTPTGTVGTDVVQAEVVCGSETYTAALTIDTHAVEVNSTSDCLETSSLRNPTPGTAFTVQVRDSSGYIANAPVDLHLEIDPDYLSPASFSNVQASLHVDGSPVGATDASGASSPYATTTGVGQSVNGAVKMAWDYSDGGARVQLVAAVPSVSCQVYGGESTLPINFYELQLESVSPNIGCIEGVPCTIPAGADAPEVEVTLSQAGQAVAGASVTFTTQDTHTGSPPAASSLVPGPVATTDAQGKAVVAVGNNESAAITSVNPLATLVDATTGGDPGVCSGGSIAAASPRAAFNFEGAVDTGVCEVDVQQSYLSLDGGRQEKQCLHAFNPAETGACASKLTGIKFELYNAAGTALEPALKVKKIEGGGIATTTSCSTTGKKILFDKACWAPGTELPNGTRFDFTNDDKCDVPPSNIDPQSFLIFSLIEWSAKPAAGRRMDVTLYYDCAGECSSMTALSETFQLTTQ